MEHLVEDVFPLSLTLSPIVSESGKTPKKVKDYFSGVLPYSVR